MINSQPSPKQFLQIIYADHQPPILKPLNGSMVFTVGRKGEDVDLEFPEISRKQFQLLYDAPYYYIRNSSKTIDTYLNSEALPYHQIHERYEEPLRNKDQIRFQNFTIIFIDQQDTLDIVNMTNNNAAKSTKVKASKQNKATLQRELNVVNNIPAQLTTELILKLGSASYAGKTVALTPKLYKFLTLLRASYPEMCSKEEIQANLFGEFEGDLYHLVAQTRKRLNEGLGGASNGDEWVVNVQGFGYKLNLGE